MATSRFSARAQSARWIGAALLICHTEGPAQILEGRGFPVDYATVEFELVPVAGQVHMLAGAGGNIGVFAGTDGVVLVDAQFAPLTERIRAEIAKINSAPIRFLINTHFHGDHTGSNMNLGATGTLIIAHENVRRTLAQPHYIEMIDTLFGAFDSSGLPVVTFEDSVTLHLNGEQIDIFHPPPAHTNGDSIIYFRGSDVIHMGDIYRTRGQPLFDRRNGGSFEGLIEASDFVLTIMGENTKIIPGHGVISSKADLQEIRDIMATVRDRIVVGIERGQSLGQIIASNPSGDFGWLDARLTVAELIEWIYLELAAR
jgi:cyclase